MRKIYWPKRCNFHIYTNKSIYLLDAQTLCLRVSSQNK